MAIRLPLQTILNYVENNGTTSGAASVAGGVPVNFYVPQDSDNIVVKLVASVTAGGYSALVQTTDDGGTNWYDVARTSIVSNTAGNYNAEWLSIPVAGFSGSRVVSSLIAPGSIVGVTGSSGGRAAPSTLSSGTVSGIPILGVLNRVFVISTGNVTATSMVQIQVKVNSQAPSA